MAFLFRQTQYTSTGQRLTGFARYTEVLERNIRKYLFTNLMTLLCFLPFDRFASTEYCPLLAMESTIRERYF